MQFRDLSRQLLDAQDPLHLFAQRQQQMLGIKPDKSEVALAEAALRDAVARHRTGRALAAARSLLLLAGPVKMIERVQRMHALRASQHGFSNKAAETLISDLTCNGMVYGLNQSHYSYLHSAAELWSLAPSLKRLQQSLIERLRAKRPYAIKTLLAHVDVAFTYDKQADRGASTDTLEAYSTECFAQAFSYLLSLYHKEIGLLPGDMGLVDEASAWHPYFGQLLIDAAKICEYLEAELLIEAFPYSATAQNGLVNIQSIDPGLERSVRMGYIQMEFQQAIRSIELHQERNSADRKVASMLTLAQDFYTRSDGQFVNFVVEPIARYVMALPFGGPLHDLFASDAMFLEDLASLDALGTEDYVAPSRVVDTPVAENITVLDIQKVQRLFYFFQHGMQHAIDQHYPVIDRPLVHLTSCIPVFRRADLLRILEMIVGAEKASPMLTLLTTDHSAHYVDIQYAPVIAIKDWCMLSVTVASRSNLVRNILCHANKRLELKDDDDKDPMEVALLGALRQAGFLVAHNQDLGPKSNRLETDIVAYRDKHLFLIECKNAFHPCNVYEQRNSYDHIVKGAEQLTLRKAWIEGLDKQRWLFDHLGWDVTTGVQIHTCIAIGNRVFNGYCCEGHPVRQVHELLNLLRDGTLNLNHTIYRLWKDECFSVDDLCAYLDGSIIIEEFVQAMEPVMRRLNFGEVGLAFHSYALDVRQLMMRIEGKYPVVHAAPEQAGVSGDIAPVGA